VLSIRDLNVVKAGTSICRLRHLDLNRGERLAVLGRNGSGKTTLLRVIGGLEKDFDGQCRIAVAPRNCVYLHQLPYLFRGTVLFNVAYGLAARKVDRRETRRRAHHWLEVFGVEHLAQRRCAHLSGGERRRVALARVFAVQPEMLLLDEPLADLDEVGVDLVCNAIPLLPQTTIVISSPNPLPRSLCVRTLELLK
jgi:tungstate transport system ATP-binding protein